MMITQKTYKKILDAMPEGVFVFDDKLRVKATNAAFRRSFAETVKKNASLSQAIGCMETCACGEGENCGYCAFYRAMRSAVEERKEKTETVRTTVKRADHTAQISMRIRVFPADEKGKLFVGITDGTYEAEMEREMLSAQRMQQRLLPAAKSMGGVPYAYTYIPCLGVGGDLPDVYEWDNQTYGVLADVSGKGVSAGMLSAFVKAAFDRKETDLAKALSKLSVKFGELEQDERSYITVAAVRIDKAKQVLRYVSAGHNVPILLRSGEGISEIESPAPPISNWIPDFTYRENELPYQRGDMLVLLTDGVTECMNAKGEQFGIQRAESVMLQSRSAEDFIGKLKAALAVFSGGTFSDDITAIAFDL